MNISKAPFPPTSSIYGPDYDYVDSYQGTYLDADNSIRSTDIGKAFFSSAPKWSAVLFDMRNKIVSLFGLKTPDKMEDRQAALKNFNCEPNERLGLFQVYSKTEDEVVIGEDDKHLNFRISLLKKDDLSKEGMKKLIISTTVEFNNWFGKLYFLPVKPFHRLIVPSMLKGLIRKLEQENRTG